MGKVKWKNICLGNPVNRSWTLSRKHVIEAIDNSLKRLQLDYVDIIYAHMFDPMTPMEEICRGFNQIIEDGKAFYWATSNWGEVYANLKIDLNSRGHKSLRKAGASQTSS